MTWVLIVPVSTTENMIAKAATATELPLYDAACKAVAEAKSVDEVKSIRDQAVAIQLYARMARDKSLEADAAEIRERAEYRLGEMLAAQREAGLLNPGTRLIGGGDGAGGFVRNPPAELPTLRDLGINKTLANKARKASALPKETFQAALTERRRQILASARIDSLLTIANRLKMQAERKAIQEAATSAMPPLLTDRYRLIHADMSTTDAVEAASVDAIVTDAPYPREYLPCFEHLGRRGFEWLKPGGSLLVMSGQSYLPDVFAALAKSGLVYRWTLCCHNHSGRERQPLLDRHIIQNWKPVLWYTKGDCKHLRYTPDVIPADPKDKRFHHWGQSVKQMERLVELASLEGQTILDPFCGGGTTGVAALRLQRMFIGLDIDQTAIAQTATRLKDADRISSENFLFCLSNAVAERDHHALQIPPLLLPTTSAR